MMNRREAIRLGLAAGGGLVLSSAVAGRPSAWGQEPPPVPNDGTSEHDGAGHAGVLALEPTLPPVVLPPAFSVTMPVPPVLRPAWSLFGSDYYVITSRSSTSEIVPGLMTEHLSYNGTFIGPTIRARVGRRVFVEHRNRTDMATSAHLHGGHVSSDNDGQPMNTIDPGRSKTYHYPNRQHAASLWYHDHAHHMEAEHTYRGLAGFYLLTDPAEASLRLPDGEFDVPIMLRDANIREDGSLFFDLADRSGRTTVLVNGRPQPRFEVAARKYRFRVLNASNRRTFTLSLGTDVPFQQIGSDGGLLAAPHETASVRITPGERVELVVDFGHFAVGTQLELQNTSDATGPTRQVMRFDVVRTARDRSRVPSHLRDLPALAPVTNERTITFDRTAAGQFVIDDKVFDPSVVNSTVTRGATEIWTLHNVTGGHNFHPHLVQFRVLTRNGAAPLPEEAGVKDVVWLAAGDTVRIQATFDTYLGRYPYHCHILDHASEGMMAQMEIVR
jgi:FtsP/CotA-like multicopper oxidase with cupredoxin domain